jgi:hypothetical protein
MPTVTFKFDKERDLWNNWDKSNKVSPVEPFIVPVSIKKICEGKTFEEAKPELKKDLQKIHSSYLIKLQIKTVEKAWGKIEKEYFHRMDRIMKHKYQKDSTAYLTTSRYSPYNAEEYWFMFGFFSSIPHAIQTCGHELMHFYFHNFYWANVEKELGKEKTWRLKEALTVLLNLEFRDLWFALDEGKKGHEELRKFIAEEWKKEKDFDNLIEKCITKLKVEEVK